MNNTNSKIIFSLISFVLIIGRLLIQPRLINIPTMEGCYETFAHIFVGYLIAAAIYWQKSLTTIIKYGSYLPSWMQELKFALIKNIYCQLTIVISLWELFLFTIQASRAI